VISGLGTGLVFAAVYGNALKWFPDRRGFATGLTAAGFAGGGVVTVVALGSMIKLSGYEAAYLWFGLGQGIVVMVSALLLHAPRQAENIAVVPAQMPQGKHHHAFSEVLRSPPFWLMYAMFVMVGAGGLMLQAQLAPIAADFAIDNVPVSILGVTMLTPLFAVSFGQVTNGLSRPVFGWVSDWSGREHTMFIAFLLESARSSPTMRWRCFQGSRGDGAAGRSSEAGHSQPSEGASEQARSPGRPRLTVSALMKPP
jgi:OFA family oxalate/formate antiporter-like MFS transporter